MTSAVYFDLDGTLVTFDRAYDRLLIDALTSAGVSDPEPVAEAYDSRFFGYFEAFADDPYRAALADAFDMCDVESDPARVAEELVATELEATVPRDGARATIDRLGDTNALGVLTNGVPDVQQEKLGRVGLAGAFDEIVVSYEVGAHKPDPAVFEAARERLDAEEYVYVGDDYEHDIAPARDAGFLAVQVDGSETGIVTSSGFDDLLSLGELFSI